MKTKPEETIAGGVINLDNEAKSRVLIEYIYTYVLNMQLNDKIKIDNNSIAYIKLNNDQNKIE